jgi:perosamine synthetase
MGHNALEADKWINQMEPWFGAEEKSALLAYMDSGGWLTEHTKTRELEQMVADYVGSAYCSMLSNGTVALATAVMALGIGNHDEVIVPNYTMIASANAIVLAGARPVLVDIERETLCLDLDLVEAAITPSTKAIMIVSLNGRSPNMRRLMSIAEEHHLNVIEDAAQSLGSQQRGKHLGTIGHIGSFSFSAPKVITTGQGGALVTDDPELANQIRKIKDFGRRESGVDVHEIMGFNFKFTDLQAVIGIEQMKKLPWRVQRKKEIFGLYKQELNGVPGIDFIPTNQEETSPWFVDILVNDPLALRQALKQQRIGTRPFHPAINSQRPYRAQGHFPVSEYVATHGLWLPSSSFLSDDDVRQVCRAIREILLATV